MERQKDRGRTLPSLTIQLAVCVAGVALFSEPLVCGRTCMSVHAAPCVPPQEIGECTDFPRLMLRLNWGFTSDVETPTCSPGSLPALWAGLQRQSEAHE